MSGQAQKFKFFDKSSLWVSVVHDSIASNTKKKNIIDSPQLCRWGKMEKMQLLFIMGIVLFLSYVSNSGKYQRIFLILSIASCTKKQHHLPSTLQVGKVGEEATVIRYGNCSIFSPPFDRTFALSYEQWALFPLSVQCTVTLRSVNLKSKF